MPKQRIAIIGSGLGGLALAQGLRDSKHEVTVYEADAGPASRRQGYRLHIDSEGMAALRRVLPDDLWRLFVATSHRPRPVMSMLDTNLKPRFSHGADTDSAAAPDAPEHVAVSRLTLREILATGLDQQIRYGKRCVGYERDGSAVVARFADGGWATADVLVGADGVNSVVRGRLLPHARVMDSGMRGIYATVDLDDETRELFPEAMFGVFGAIADADRNWLGGAPVEFTEPLADTAARLAPAARLTPTESFMTCGFGGRVENLPCTDAALATMSPEELRDLAASVVADWHPTIGEIVRHWRLDSVFPLFIRSSVPVAPWRPGPVTLLGDAIHAMSPAGGAGANNALRDAAQLSAALERATETVAAIGQYEAAMRDYGFAAVRMAAEWGHKLFGQRRLETVVA
ncbi:MAG TPA: NAD(P)/FAD-dependent oxidoreductase [Stackebrandtia sp.]|jgi:2-polyprenyl-6-methoxyphenol hydroxylase-like FAD-dependent oxidoreductase|uniref:FAD-dependent oxidoreductase n=1 Tax=Stackebrandtia sp. TaxID=2023065 RepID=UPI002D4DB601|nr:NAD(P)/FAD-dependent oxidoreductase [Stackebrandtia sp.]HZE38525.1 NAD(P)/FAD-dependent oxidoreductase [Stackebrandtia sp.]